MTQTIKQLTARIAELEAEKKELQALLDFDNARLDQIEDELEDVEYLGPYVEGIKVLKTQLAASQLREEQLREALETLNKVSNIGCGLVEEALAIPHDTSTLDAYVAENVKEIIESHAPDGRNVTNAQHVEMRQKFFDQIATLTRQRDLAVEALKSCGVNDGLNGPTQYFDEDLVERAIKESDGK